MRHAFALLERVAATEATVLLEGETGTGKELAAAAIHDAGPRTADPFVVVDCGSIPDNLLESELFGHERGAFTGAEKSRAGAFEEAHGGTIFLDEIGELPLPLQPALLRVLEERSVRRVGSRSARKSVDVRVVAATNRDLRAEVNAGRFRGDLFYRLAVLRVRLPSLRDRLEDLPLLVETLLRRLGATPDAKRRLTRSAFLRSLRRHSWDGNVRELRNYLERALVFGPPEPSDAAATDPGFNASKRRAIEAFEREYLAELIAGHDENVTAAAKTAGINRVTLHRLLRKHGYR